MTYLALERIAPRVAAVMLSFVAVCGCERDAVAPQAPEAVPRTKDPEYQKALKDVQARRREIAGERAKVADEMRELAEKARAALPKGADEKQVRAELEAHPEKYPGWKDLELRLKEIDAKAKKDLSDARDLVRARILKEQNDLNSQQKRGGSK